MWIAWLLACCSATAVLCQSASYSNLPSAALYADGNFSSPGGPTQVYTQGAYLNITWESDYPSVNLYLIRGQDFAHPITVAINYAQTWYNWQIDGGHNLTKPFLFRVVNAQGTEEDQLDGGFDSEQFWIAPSHSSTSLTSTLSSTTLRSGHAPTSSGAKPTTSSSATVNNSSSGLSQGATIGIGVGVGIGVAILVLAAIAFFFWRRLQKRKERISPSGNNQPHPPYNNQMSYSQGPTGPPGSYRDNYSGSNRHESYGPWSPHHSQSRYSAAAYELPHAVKSPVEAPANYDPQELHGHAIALKPGSRE